MMAQQWEYWGPHLDQDCLDVHILDPSTKSIFNLTPGYPQRWTWGDGVALSLVPMWPHWTNIIFLFSIINLIFLNWHIEDGRLNLTWNTGYDPPSSIKMWMALWNALFHEESRCEWWVYLPCFEPSWDATHPSPIPRRSSHLQGTTRHMGIHT